jgi:hypothetical protein
VPPKIAVPVSTVADVKIKVFTSAFRKVWEADIPSMSPPGREVPLPLADKWGAALANGLYYVVVSTDGGILKVKWLILR